MAAFQTTFKDRGEFEMSFGRKVICVVAIALSTAMLAVFCGCNAGTSTPAHLVLRLGHVQTIDTHYQLAALEFARLVKDKTNGRIEVAVYPQSQLGGEVQMTQAVRTGTQDLAIIAQAVVENTVKEWQIFDVPYLFDSVDQANRILQGPVGITFMNMLPQHDLVGLAWFSCLERNVFTATKPVRTLNDLKGLKIRVLQSPGYVSAFRALGANPTPLAYSELYLAVQQGVVDGGDTPPDQFVKDKFLEVAKNYSLTRINDQAIVFLMSKAVMDKLPKDDQNAILDAAKQAAQYDIKLYKDDTDKALKEIEQKGVHIIHVDTKPWIEATNAIRADLISKIPSGEPLYREIVAAKAAAAN